MTLAPAKEKCSPSKKDAPAAYSRTMRRQQIESNLWTLRGTLGVQRATPLLCLQPQLCQVVCSLSAQAPQCLAGPVQNAAVAILHWQHEWNADPSPLANQHKISGTAHISTADEDHDR